jgi:hypothetical protein
MQQLRPYECLVIHIPKIFFGLARRKAELPASRNDRICQQHTDGHGANASGDRRNTGGLLTYALKVDIAYNSAIRQTIDSHVYNLHSFIRRRISAQDVGNACVVHLGTSETSRSSFLTESW